MATVQTESKETTTAQAEALSQQLRERIRKLAVELCDGLYERDEVMRLALLTAIAGESIFLLGPPGVGKSLIARRLKYAFADGKTFEYLMTRFSTPDEVFGPISIRRLKDEDRYERITENYMPDASVVFLDEIWKASSSIQNALLTIINERVYRNGQQEVPVNIRAIITASNELPPATESFGPLWDRLLVRYDVEGIRQSDNFVNMITDTGEVYKDPVSEELKVTQLELDEWTNEIDAVTVPDEVVRSLQMIRERITKWNEKNGSSRPILIYDRRWKKIIRLIRSSAFLNGRDQVDLMDLFLILHCLWNEPAQLEPLREIVARTIREHGYSIALPLGGLMKEVEQFEEEVDEEITVRTVDEEEVLTPFDDQWFQLEKPDQQFEGSYIKINDFNRLGLEEQEVTNFYDPEGKLVNRLGAAKSRLPFSIVVRYNSKDHTYRLLTHKREREKMVRRKAHDVVVKHWNTRYAALREDLDSALAKIKSDRPAHWEALQEHLFTDQRLAPLVKANLEEVGESLEKLSLRLEKLRYRYEEEG